MSEPLALYAADEAVGVVTINRPDKLNAITEALREELVAALHRADADPATRVVLLQGAGRSFCAGFDISGNRPDRDAWRYDALKWHSYLTECLDFILLPWRMKKPVVAAVQGNALGAGCELALACDFTIAARDARFGEPEVRFSSVGPAVLLPWFVGYKRARELLYLGDTIGADEALSLGMLNRVVPTETLPADAMAFARRLSLISAEALAGAKLAINRGADAAGFGDAMRAGLDIVAPLYAARTEDRVQFRKITEEQGLGAALRWRKSQFD